MYIKDKGCEGSQLCESNLNSLDCHKLPAPFQATAVMISSGYVLFLFSSLLYSTIASVRRCHCFPTLKHLSSLSTAMHTCHRVAAFQAEPWILNCYLNDRLYALCHAQLVEIVEVRMPSVFNPEFTTLTWNSSFIFKRGSFFFVWKQRGTFSFHWKENTLVSQLSSVRVVQDKSFFTELQAFSHSLLWISFTVRLPDWLWFSNNSPSPQKKKKKQ